MKENYWNCRILEHNDGVTWYALHEVHYENDKPVGWTEDEIAVHGDTLEWVNFCMQAHIRSMYQPVLRIEGDELVETDIILWPWRNE